MQETDKAEAFNRIFACNHINAADDRIMINQIDCTDFRAGRTRCFDIIFRQIQLIGKIFSFFVLHYRIGKVLHGFYVNFGNSTVVYVYGIGEFVRIHRLLRSYLFETEIQQSTAFGKTGSAVRCF